MDPSITKVLEERKRGGEGENKKKRKKSGIGRLTLTECFTSSTPRAIFVRTHQRFPRRNTSVLP